MSFSPRVLASSLARLPAAGRYLVAYSGGRDSLALLHAFAVLRDDLQASVEAVHVNHGLHPQADAWEETCAVVAAGLGVPLHRLAARPGTPRGRGLEAAARAGRYAALERLAGPRDAVCTAHHADDQAETVLFNLLRGSGPAGLAAMPGHRRLGDGLLLRPLLEVPGAALRDYAVRTALPGVEDPSNRDQRHDRNYLRHRALPALVARWPAAVRTLGRAARVQADALAILDEAAAETLEAVRVTGSGRLSAAALAALSAPRRRLVLRAWLAGAGLPAPGEAHLSRVETELLGARRDATPIVRWRGCEVRRYRGELHAMPPLAPLGEAAPRPWRPGRALVLPHGTLGVRPASGAGVDRELVAGADVEVRFRRGGERLRPAGGEHSRPLKSLLREHGVPPWERDRLPLVFCGDRLAAVADLWVSSEWAARPRAPGWRLWWRPHPHC